MRAAPLLLAALAATTLARSASAYERQQHFGLEAGGALSSTSGAGNQLGGVLAGRYTYGFSDAINILAEVGEMPLTSEARPAKNVPPQPGNVGYAGAGLAYVFDVTQWVPYAGAMIGPAYVSGGLLGSPFWTVDAQLTLGLDWQLSRSWSIGAAGAQHMLLTRLSTYPEMTTLGLRVEYVWGW
jgi:hypothetical protein